MKLYENKYPISESAEYVCDYVYSNTIGHENYYYQLVRLRDNAILCSYKDKARVIAHCLHVGISKNKVSFI